MIAKAILISQTLIIKTHVSCIKKKRHKTIYCRYLWFQTQCNIYDTTSKCKYHELITHLKINLNVVCASRNNNTWATEASFEWFMPVCCEPKQTVSCREGLSHAGGSQLSICDLTTPLQMKPTCTTLTYLTLASGQWARTLCKPVTLGSVGRDIIGLVFPDPAHVPVECEPAKRRPDGPLWSSRARLLSRLWF